MSTTIVKYSDDEKQQKIKKHLPISPVSQELFEFELTRLTKVRGKKVFCPMCQDWHENNTLCQMIDSQGGDDHEVL